MPTFDVAFPVTKPVIFPRKCVVCEKPDPSGAVKISVLGSSSGPVLEMAADQLIDGGVSSYAGGNTSNTIPGIPACKGACSWSLKWYHRLLKFAMYTAWLPGVILIVINKTPIWLSVIFLILCVITPPIISIMFPPAFGGTFVDGTANFEFRSLKIAEEFMEINGIPKADKKAAAA